ncbi:MAG: hypothetical protein GY828_08465 [Candidatus Gracilibacteria bacterium]|nr:hypothetical protein [Candidatus Gracilibacteria bacterium]
MKKIILGLCATLLLIPNVSAGEGHYVDPGYGTPIIDDSLNFTATRDGYEVTLEWDEYSEDDFKYYKIMRSETHKSPVYPDQGAIGVYDDQEKTTFGLHDRASFPVHYRVCVITDSKGRVCSEVVALEGAEKMDYEKKEHYKEKKEYIKKDYTKKVVQYKKKAHLDSKLQKRADTLVKKLVDRLEKKYGTDTESKTERLNTIISKLETLEAKTKSEKTKALVSYILEALKVAVADMTEIDDVENIFDLLEE